MAAPDGAAGEHERAKDFLTKGEVMRLLDVAKGGRHGVRDPLLLIMSRHGLQVSKAVAGRHYALGNLFLRRYESALPHRAAQAGSADARGRMTSAA